ncbi:hypothetical protein [Pedococcus sp. P5_B7]
MTTRMVLLGCLLLATAGCGAAGDTPGRGASPTTPPPASSSSPTSTPTDSFTEDLTPTSPSGRGRVVTVRGTIADGAEAGCLTLTEAEGSWLLVGQTSGLKAGDTVTVRGAVMEDLVTTCQQGQPLWVDEVLER